MKRILCLALACGVLAAATPALANKLDDIKARGTLICGVKDSVVPFGFIDETTKQLTGFDVDLCRGIAEYIGVAPESLSRLRRELREKETEHATAPDEM